MIEKNFHFHNNNLKENVTTQPVLEFVPKGLNLNNREC